MRTFTTAVKTFMQDEGGVTAIEYGLIAALIATVLISSLGVVRTGLVDTFHDVAVALGAA